jgi:outer membrane protein OmpA-like peptidoglycan-associated protein
MKHMIIVAAAAALLASCATVPQDNARLDQARTEIQTLSADPLAQQAAEKDLESARSWLQRAETAFAQRKPTAEVDHLAYLAQRHAEAGAARVQEAQARQEIARAEEQRNRVLLDARSREADAANSKLVATQAALAALQAKQTDRGVVVTLGDVLFDTAQATLKPGADLTLDRLADYMKNNAQARVMIEGHTDSRGSDEYNDVLSERRADAVAAALIRRGVSSDNLKAIGRGKAYPVATNDTPEGRQQNRRVEIVFSDASGNFAKSALDQPAHQ